MIKEKAVKRLDGERRKNDSKSRREKEKWRERGVGSENEQRSDRV
jgi:hypothetical protein